MSLFRTRTRPASVLALAAVTAAAAGLPAGGQAPASPFAGPVTEVASPAPVGSAQPNLAVDGRGQVYLSWLEPREGGGHAFRMAARRGPGWAPPVTIAEGDNFLANWADFPAVFISAKGTMVAHWLERGSQRAAYGIRLRTSTDGGRTWTGVVTPHRDDSQTEHGFVSFFDQPGGDIGLIWLDGRAMAARGGTMALRATTITGGVPGEEAVVDPKTCECCQTSAARTADGVVAAFRDRSDGEIRDIAVSRLEGGRWTPPAIVHADNWQISGCPVNGPVVVADGRTVAVAWFTGAGGTPHTWVAFSTDAGRTFGRPIALDEGVTLGRLGMTLAGPGRVLVSSIERAGGDTRFVVREVRQDGRTSGVLAVAPVSPDRPSGFPRLVVSGRTVVLAWTDSGGGRPLSVRTATAALPPGR